MQCHIVGMNNKTKEEFKKHINKYFKSIKVYDLDNITLKIRSDKTFRDLNNKLKSNNYKNKKVIRTKMQNLWKTKFQQRIDKIKKNSILIGLSSYHKNHNICVKIDTPYKFFFNIDPKANARDIIDYNIEKHRKYILNGSFPVKYLDFNFLVQQRIKIKGIYEKIGYKNKSGNFIHKFIQRKQSHLTNTKMSGAGKAICPVVYYASDKKYTGYVDIWKNSSRKKLRARRTARSMEIRNFLGIKDTKLLGYTEDWLSMVSAMGHGKIKKGYRNNKPFIREKECSTFNFLDGNVYLYELSGEGFYRGKDGYKKYSMEPAKIISVRKIDNIGKLLKKKGVEFIKYKEHVNQRF